MKLARRGSTGSWRYQRKVSGRVNDLVVCVVQLKHQLLGVQEPQKQLLKSLCS